MVLDDRFTIDASISVLSRLPAAGEFFRVAVAIDSELK